jgi:hypothetical protein
MQMSKPRLYDMVKILLGFILTSISLNVCGQKKIDSTGQVAFVYFEKRKTNLIVIPNVDRLYSFKIYRKAGTDTLFVQVGEKKRPPLPMKYNITPYSVTWEDKEYNTADVIYRILAFDKKGTNICELKVIWENQLQTDSL